MGTPPDQTESLVLHAKRRLKRRERLLVLAHPGSGTRWLRDLLNKAKFTPVAHEVVNPNRGAEDYRVVISYRYWDFEPWHYVWHFVREPARTVFSAAAVFYNKKSRPRYFQHYDLKPDEKFEPSGSAVYDMMKTLYVLNCRADRFADLRFRVEDLPPREDPNQYTHVKKVRPLEDLWEEMSNIDRSLAHALKVQATKYGY